MQQTPSKLGPGSPARPAEAIRQLVVPQVAPPYDDEADDVAPSTQNERNGGCHGAAAWTPPGQRGYEQDPGHRITPHSADQGVSRRNQNDQGTIAAAWPGQFAQVLAETLAGSRPPGQLAPWTTEQARREIRELGPRFVTGERPLVRRVMATAPASGVLELTAVVGFGPRVRVLALRLERSGSGPGWCCTAVESA